MQSKKKKIVVFSGAGISAESGLKTFRDHGGLWEKYDISEVATPQAWEANRSLVLSFYNMRRKQLFKAKPNPAHYALAKLEAHFEVDIITQNIDDLHEKAGSSKVTHLHGELKKVQSEKYPELVYDFEKEAIELGDVCERGHQLRPHVVWFGEAVPLMEKAYEIAQKADIFIVVGTSLNVYPAAGIINFVPQSAECWLIDPSEIDYQLSDQWNIIQDKAGRALPEVASKLIQKHKKRE